MRGVVQRLHHRLPAVVLYRLGSWRTSWMYRNLLTTPYFSSPNLLAGREVLPEFCFHGAGPRPEVQRALAALFDDGRAQELQTELERAAAKLGPAGAIERAAGHIVAHACERLAEAAG